MKLFRNIPHSIKQVTVIFSLLQFINYFNFFWLIQNIYFLEHQIDYKKLAVLLAIWSMSAVILEVPSGILADKVGRKLTIVIGKIAFFLGLLCFVAAPNYPFFVLGMLFWGMHDAFISGAQEALLFDKLKEEKSESSFQRVWSLATLSREIGLGVGVLLAGFLTSLSMTFTLNGALIIAIFGVVVSLFLPHSKQTFVSEEVNLLKDLRSTISQVRSNTFLLQLIVFSLFSLVTYQVISEYFIVSLHTLSIKYEYIGIISFIEMLSFAFGVYLADKIKGKNTAKVYAFIAVLLSLGMVGIGSQKMFFVIAAWLFLRVVKAIAEILISVDWQYHVRSEDRATSTSVKSFMGSIFYIPLGYAFGYFADKYSLFNAFYFIAVVPLFYLLAQKLLATRRSTES